MLSGRMKKILLVLLGCCGLATGGYAQDIMIAKATKDSLPQSQIFTFVEQMPEFPGGQQQLYKFLSANLRYPATARAEGIEGRVILRFVVDTTGAVTQPRIERGVDKALDEEALRVVNMMPRWKPGKNNGSTVRVYYRLPVYFKLEKDIVEPKQ